MSLNIPGVPAERVVVDIGNSRIKFALLDAGGRLVLFRAAPIEHEGANLACWADIFDQVVTTKRTRWAIASVNPRVGDEFAKFLAKSIPMFSMNRPAWYRSAADVPIGMKVRNPKQAGSDRALAVLAGRAIAPPGLPGLVISCGTALTIERVTADGTWEGGTIAPGLGLAARSLHKGTAQIPRYAPGEVEKAWGDSTESAVGGGVFWGTVGAARELIVRQEVEGWRIWTGGDARAIAPAVEVGARIVPDLVLRGLAMAAFGATAEAIAP